MAKKNSQSFYTFNPSSTDFIIFDTNILINIFYPLNFTNNTQPYEDLFLKIKKAKSNLVLSSIQVSEFINYCIRLQYNLYKEVSNNECDFKKDYRNTKDYETAMNAILEIVNNDIKTNFSFINDDFNSMDYNNIFKYGFSYDFNDALLAELSRLRNLILVTNDCDFLNYSSTLKIVTSNSIFL